MAHRQPHRAEHHRDPLRPLPAAAASGHAADENTPLRRHAKALRRILFCVPARITRTARQTILRLPTGFRYLDTFRATYRAVSALGVP